MLCFHDSRDQRGKHIVPVNGMVYVAFYKTKLHLVKQKLFLNRNVATICTQTLISLDRYDALCHWQERFCSIIHFSKDISTLIMTLIQGSFAAARATVIGTTRSDLFHAAIGDPLSSLVKPIYVVLMNI